MSIRLMQHANGVMLQVAEGVVIEKVVPAIYKVHLLQEGVFLSKYADSFKQPDRIYGTKVPTNINHVSRLYNDGDKSVGVILSGNKGNGKSLFGERLVNKAIDNANQPCIFIDEYIPRQTLQYLSDNLGELTFFFDEYEKNYLPYDKECDTGPAKGVSMLTYFSENSKYKRLNILTINDACSISNLMVDRPGRCQFYITHSEIDMGAVNDLLEEKKFPDLINEVLRESVKVKGVRQFNFDSLMFLCSRIEQLMAQNVDISDADLLEEIYSLNSVLNLPHLVRKLRTVLVACEDATNNPDLRNLTYPSFSYITKVSPTEIRLQFRIGSVTVNMTPDLLDKPKEISIGEYPAKMYVYEKWERQDKRLGIIVDGTAFSIDEHGVIVEDERMHRSRADYVSVPAAAEAMNCMSDISTF